MTKSKELYTDLGKGTASVDAFIEYGREHGFGGLNVMEAIRHFREHVDPKDWNSRSNTYATPKSRWIDGD